MIDFSKAINFVMKNADAFREIYEDGKNLYTKVLKLYLQWQEPVAMGSTADLAELGPETSALLEKMSLDTAEDGDTMQAVSVVEIIRFLVVYGPLIKQILDEIRKKKESEGA